MSIIKRKDSASNPIERIIYSSNVIKTHVKADDISRVHAYNQRNRVKANTQKNRKKVET